MQFISMTKATKVLGFMLAIVIVATAFSGCLNIPRKIPEEVLPDEEITSEQEIEKSSIELKTFSSYEELREHVKNFR